MGSTCRHSTTSPRPALRACLLAALGLWLFCAGGCAVLPFTITTAASFAMPQTASLAMTGVKGVYNTAMLASDERDINTILRDNMLGLKAKSALLPTQGASDVHVYAYNGEVFAVGVVETEADRERVVRAMQNVKGVGAVKGHIRLRELDNPVSHMADVNLENRARLALSRHLLHKNSGVDVQAVQGELCLMGVVGTHAEALDLIQYIESTSGARTRSLLAIRDEYGTGRAQTNRLYLLDPGEPAEPRGLSLQDDAPPLPRSPIVLAASPGVSKLAPATAQNYRPQNKARAFAQQRLTLLAKRTVNPQARAELLTVAAQVAQDRDLSISDRLSVAAAQVTQQQSKVKIQALLAMY